MEQVKRFENTLHEEEEALLAESSDFKPWILIPVQNYASEPNEVLQVFSLSVLHQLTVLDASSDGENGTDEKRKAGKSPTVSQQTPTSEMEYFDDRKKVDVARTKSSTDSPVLTIKSDSKIERKKRASNQLKANAHFHKLFLDVPSDEPLKQSFTCALQKEILYQGKLFLSENWICFHSKVFGKDTKISIPVLSVTLLKKTKTALLVPNALIIATVTDRDFNEDYSDLDGIVQQRRQEMEESSSTGSQTPELECFQDYHVVETETHLKVSKPEAKSVRSDAHTKRGPDGKARNSPRNGQSEAFRFLHKVKSQKLLSLNHILVFYAILVCVLILSTFYMRYKISVLEERLMSMTAFDSHIKEHQVRQDLGSHLQINADAFCDELTANLRKLEKCLQDWGLKDFLYLPNIQGDEVFCVPAKFELPLAAYCHILF
ncbi:GRAM domain-containing protein 3 [Turdus rufiventris]|nr:GRAM domain-containing protein 3 [Turdus rufiventris]